MGLGLGLGLCVSHFPTTKATFPQEVQYGPVRRGMVLYDEGCAFLASDCNKERSKIVRCAGGLLQEPVQDDCYGFILNFLNLNSERCASFLDFRGSLCHATSYTRVTCKQ